MATLTWQDVAGHVKAPDNSNAAAAITRGIEGIGESVAALGAAPGDRRKEAALKQMQMLGMQRTLLNESADHIGQFGDDTKTNQEDAAAKEWGANRSILEAAARNTIANGGTAEDFFKSDAFLGQSEGAKSLGAGHLSNALYQGEQARERDEDDARAQRNSDRSFALQQRGDARSAAAAQRAAKEHTFKIADLKTKKDAADKEAAAKKFSDEKITQKVLTDRLNNHGERLHTAMGGAFAPGGKKADQALSDIAKLDPEDLREARVAYQEYNQRQRDRGKEDIPFGVFMDALDSQIGASWNPFNDFDPDALETHFDARQDQIESLLKEGVLLTEKAEQARKGAKFTDKQIMDDLQKIRDERKKTPELPPIRTDPNHVLYGGR